ALDPGASDRDRDRRGFLGAGEVLQGLRALVSVFISAQPALHAASGREHPLLRPTRRALRLRRAAIAGDRAAAGARRGGNLRRARARAFGGADLLLLEPAARAVELDRGGR